MGKTYLIAALTIVVAALFLFDRPGKAMVDDDDLQLKELWKEYRAAESKDLPQKQLSLLEKIRSESLSKNIPYDYYLASEYSAQVRRRINWKDAEKAREDFRKSVEDYGLPVMDMMYLLRNQSSSSALEYARAHAPQLRQSNVAAFHDAWFGSSAGLDSFIGGLVRNDLEFALWACRLRGEKCSDELKGLVEERYPDRAILEYLDASDGRLGTSGSQALADHARKYEGKAASMLSRAALLQDRMGALERDDKSTGEQYKALYDDCLAFEKQRKAFSGMEGKLAACESHVESLVKRLESRSLDFEVEDDRLTVRFRNLDKAEVEFVSRKDGKKVWKTTVENPTGSFYVYDKVSLKIPVIDDGSYDVTLKAKDVNAKSRYNRNTISVAVREDSRGHSIYVADYKSGEPIKSVDLSLYEKGKEVASVKNLTLDGFTQLPEKIESALKQTNRTGRYSQQYLVCSCASGPDGTFRSSSEVNIYDYYSVDEENVTESTMANVMLDRCAFKPGETVQFKAIVYRNKGYDYSPVTGKNVTVIMHDAEGNETEKLKLNTNEYGSVAGSFGIPTGLRNGFFRISVMDGGVLVGDAGFRVDEFVLPSFEVRFEPKDRFFLEGDTVRIKAWANSYSGHSLASAKVYAKVGQSYRIADEELEVVTVAPDGSFELVAKDVKQGYHSVRVKVVDNTGETLEFVDAFTVIRRPSVNLEISNVVEASLRNVVVGDVLTVGTYMDYSHQTKTGNNADADIIYRLLDEHDKVVGVGSLQLGEKKDVDIKALRSGQYRIEAEITAKKADGSVVSGKDVESFVKISDDDTAFNADVESLFRVMGSGDGQMLQMAAGQGPIWACVDFFGPGKKLLRSELVKIEKGAVERLDIKYPGTWPSVVTMNVFYFRNGRSGQYRHEFRRTEDEVRLPLAVSRFTDVASPATKYSATLSSAAGVEALVSIFDKSTETIYPNYWYEIYLQKQPAPYVPYQSYCGSSDLHYYREFIEEEEMMSNGNFAGGMRNYTMMSDAAVNTKVMRAAKAESAMVLDSDEYDGYTEDDEPEHMGVVRESFANTIAFEPFLRSDKNGNISLEFTTSDKLSTYVMGVFVHDKSMHSAVTRKEFKVTVPVKLSVMEPQLLYVGDRYVLKANLSNSSEQPVSGKVSAYVYTTAKHESASPIASVSKSVSLEAGGAEGVDFEIDVPQTDVLGLKLVFSGNEDGTAVSDGLFVSVPVKRPSQTIRESHSSIVFAGQDRDAIIAQLRSLFVNVPAEAAVLSERTIMDLIREAVPEKISTEAKDVISLTESLYASVIAGTLGMEKLDGGMLDKILACRNADGGFGWFEGMDSSPVVTATVLKRAAALEDRGLSLGLDNDVLESAVKYMDTQMLKDRKRPSWCGGMSLEQYLLVRAHYADVKLAAQPSAEYRKAVSQYLVPKNGRGVNGAILTKAYRIRTLSLLTASDEGLRLAKALGVRLSAEKKMQRSLEADVASLLEYAVDHRSGGKYFPNAVMPFRGLMESELQAHALLCDIFRDFGYEELADAIRIWIMVQKETQQWDVDPAYMEALSSVMDGSEAMKDMRVLILSGENELPFQQIKSAGNGFKVEVLYKREDGSVLKSGDVLSVGDKVVSEVRIWNEENRSFVHVCVPRPASLRPENQLSGMMRWWLRPLFVDGWYSCTPQGYRNVKASMTEYFFDSYPEETTTVSETFFVTQAGCFTAPVATIECLYAPHYVANSEYTGELQSR